MSKIKFINYWKNGKANVTLILNIDGKYYPFDNSSIAVLEAKFSETSDINIGRYMDMTYYNIDPSNYYN